MFSQRKRTILKTALTNLAVKHISKQKALFLIPPLSQCRYKTGYLTATDFNPKLKHPLFKN